MAFVTGTAANRVAFRAALIDFLTTNTDLVAAGEAWEVVWSPVEGSDNMSDIVLKGPGLAGQDNVYIGMRSWQVVPEDAYGIDFRGMAGVIGSASRVTEHVNTQPVYSTLFMDTAPMEYWFIANGRRFIVVLKISTIFQCVYAGLFLPYGTPVSYPYPLFVGGAAGPYENSNLGARNWRSTNEGFSNWWNAYYAPSNQVQRSCASLMNPAGEWLIVANAGTLAHMQFGPHGTDRGNEARMVFGTDQNNYAEDFFVTGRARAAYGGDYTMMPLTLYMRDPAVQTYGIMQGVFKCQGQDNASENIITLDGVDHLVVQNTFRTGIEQYVAVALE